MKKYVLTGGPGVGKSTVIKLLAFKGYSVIPETARTVIEEECAKKSDTVPWGNLKKFQEVVAQRQLEIESEIKSGEVFLDRGIVDGYAYCLEGNIPAPKIIFDHGKNRYDKIFLLAPLSHYENDRIRKEKKEFQAVVHALIKQAYLEFGYVIIPVPMLSVEERVAFILNAIQSSSIAFTVPQ